MDIVSKRSNMKIKYVLIASGLCLLCILSGCGKPQAAGPLVALEWAGYEQQVFWQTFADQHPDVQVEYTFFADDPEAFAKLQSGFKADLVHPGSSWLKLYVENDLLLPIDTAKLRNWSSLMPELTALGQVNGVQYLVPWEWGYDSILVRTDKVSQIPTSWADLWDPQYAGHVSIFDSAEVAVLATSLALGYDAYQLTPEQLQAVQQKLIELKPNLLNYWSDYTQLNQQIASGEVWVATAWPDAYLAAQAEGIPVEYITPKEGRLGWVYGLAISKNSKHPDLALEYIDAMIELDSMIEMANQYGYGAANKQVVAHTAPEVVKLMNLDRPDVMLSTAFFKPLTAEQRKTWTSLWDQVKAAP